MKKEMKKKKRKLIDGPANGLKFVKLHCFPVEVKLLGTLYSVHQAGGETCGVPEEQGSTGAFACRGGHTVSTKQPPCTGIASPHVAQGPLDSLCSWGFALLTRALSGLEIISSTPIMADPNDTQHFLREVSEFLADKKEGQHNILKNTGLRVSRVVHGALLLQEGHLTIWGLGCPYSWPSDPVVPTQLPLACLIWTPVQQMAVTF
ncbi:uncharacterized protein LOC111559498 [Felis catus]|uniref:uncharacterized protein LOC111559498 n=1 Tax=Felis catus TaxID=9685 RepID=UPI001D199B58|nr:uncharacterized protein LOC111559498 [Felis catus]